MSRRRVVILGAAGRDFHNFNTVYRDDPHYEVLSFTAAQIPDIAARRYPAELAGALYPHGIPVVEETQLGALLASAAVDEVVFAYSDVKHVEVMHRASAALAGGADFTLLGPRRTMLAARVPVIAVSAVRTGCGKSQTSRALATWLRGHGLRVVVLRHPMPYGDLARQAVQRFATRADLDAARCTVEEREEYEPHLASGSVVYAGVDYAAILARAQDEADVLLWDGGNNDFPFVRPDLHIVLVDALRPGDECAYHPGESVLRMADIVIAAKCDQASSEAVGQVLAAAAAVNPRARCLRGASPLRLDDAARVHGKRVLVVDDGPTLTHGGMAYGAGLVAARAAGAAAIVDPRASATPAMAAVFERYPHLDAVLPALGYGARQLAELAATINASDAELVVAATPCDLAALAPITKPVLRVRYDYADLDAPGLRGEVEQFLRERGLTR
ncbi:MAG: GTPase [Proteobacteria bacterium]|nr:GTPase [Pseudomonadota bacterium]